MQSTRARIVGLLRGGGTTVDGITNELGLAPATVRRHLDVLLRDGLVEMRSERVPLGRPHFVFTLSEGGFELLPGRRFHLVASVFDTILALTPDDTRGRSGPQIAALVFDRLAAQLLEGCRPAVTASDPGLRVVQAVDALAAAGLEYEVVARDDGFVVGGDGCPCARLLTGVAECPHEPRLLSDLIGASVVRLDEGVSAFSRSFLVRTPAQGVL